MTYELVEFRPDPNLNLIIGPNEGRSAFMFAIALGLGCNTLVRNLNVLYHYANLLMKISYIRRFLKDIRNISHFIKDGQNHASIKIELKHDDDNVIIICLITRADNRTQWTLKLPFKTISFMSSGFSSNKLKPHIIPSAKRWLFFTSLH
ncbi:4746_t:CDS:2, partial [Entrophospora sp. SA101]